MRGGLSSRHRSGNHLDPGDRVRCRADAGRHRAAGITANLSGARLGRARSRGDLGGDGRDRARGDRAGGRRAPATSPASASPISARPRSSGTAPPASRSTTPSSGRTGAPPTSARAAAGRARAAGRGPHRPAARSVFLGDENRLAARSRRGRAGGRAGGPARLRHGRQLPALAADRRQRPTRPTPPMRRARSSSTSGSGEWDAEPVRAVRRAGRAVAAGARLRARIRHHAPELFGGPIRILGVAGDQQAATVGQGCFAPGMMKSTYGTGCFALLNTGAAPVASKQPPAHHHRVSARRQAHLCARRRHLHRRRRGAMAARRPESDRVAPRT